MKDRDKGKWELAIDKLLEMTKAGSLKWRRAQNVGREDLVGDVYESFVQDRRIVIWEYRYQAFTDEDQWHWDNDVAIEFVDKEGDVEWRWPETPSRWGLLDAIRYQLVGGDEFLKQLLNESQ